MHRGISDKTYKSLLSGYKKGFGNIDIKWNKPNWQWVEDIKTNLNTFAAFKSHAETIEVSQQLINSRGERRSLRDFTKAAKKISGESYQSAYLRAEYIRANASADMAQKWREIQESKELFPALEYVTERDGRVRADHQELDGSVYPVDDAFWQTYYPPNDWGCRCTVRQTRADIKPKGEINIPTEFQTNVGTVPQVYNKQHPYYKAPLNKKATAWAERFNPGRTLEFLGGSNKPPTIVPKNMTLKSHEMAQAAEYNKRGFVVEFMPEAYKHGVKHIDTRIFDRLHEFKRVNNPYNGLKKAIKQADDVRGKIDVTLQITDSAASFGRVRQQLHGVGVRYPNANINNVHVFIGGKWRRYAYKNIVKK